MNEGRKEKKEGVVGREERRRGRERGKKEGRKEERKLNISTKVIP